MKTDEETASIDSESVILHACCAPCATHVIDVLSSRFKVSVFFYNPNIQPETEFNKRLDSINKLCSIKGTELIVCGYDRQVWFEWVKGLEEEPEGGRRCSVCFEMRLEACAETALKRKIKNFATTLSISPHKNMKVIYSIGRSVADKYGLNFIDIDFGKDDGFRKSCIQSKEIGLYRQKYCGCIFSMR